MSAVTDVMVIGAGPAGLAAAVALSAAGAKTQLLERKPYVGGRAYSYPHPALGEVIDSQHVLLGCCTNLLDLCRLSGADNYLRWYEEIPFLEPGGRVTRLRGGTSPMASLGFLRAPMLEFSDKLAIVRGLTEFLNGKPQSDDVSFASWLKRTKQTERAIKHFWEPILIATLNDTFERCSMRYAGKVFHEAFVRSAEGGRMAVPTEPLSNFFGRIASLAEQQGTDLQLRASVERLERVDGLWQASLSDGTHRVAERVVLALPFEQAAKLVPLRGVEHFVHAPITTIHLWFDRNVSEYDQCALLDTRIQWLFDKSRIRGLEQQGSYIELVISASFQELEMGREEILNSAITELRSFLPKMNQAKIVKSGILKEARATFSVVPGLDAYRPQQESGAGLYLAGDWTDTGWPSTMEGGVRSGRLAAGAILGRSCMAAELPAEGIVRLLERQ